MAKDGMTLKAFGLGALLIALAVVGTMWGTSTGPFADGADTGALVVIDNQGNVIPASQQHLANCPDDGDTSLTIDVQNTLNTTGAETFDVTYYLRGAKGDFQTGSDTTAGSDTLNCGEEYMLEIIAASTDNSNIEKVLMGPGAVVEDGKVRFTPSGSSYTLRLGVSEHAALEFRAKDVDEGDFVYNSDGDATDWEADGVAFESTTNGTAKAIGVGESLNYMLYARNTGSDTDFNDYYTLILLEAPVATWDTPTLKVDDVAMSDVKGSLTAQEERQFSNYEYIYKIDQPILDGNDGIKVEIYLEALNGVNPSTDPEIDFASAGRYLSVDGVTTKVGAAKDDSSSTVVFTVMDTFIDIS